VTPQLKRSLVWGIGVVVLVLAFQAGFRFPWQATRDAVFGADPLALLGLVVVALLCLVAKGWAWHLLLVPAAPHRWRSAQDANLVGAAVNTLSVAVIGEAARIRRLMRLEGVPLGTGVASVVWARALEAVGLAVFVLSAPMVMVDLPPVLRGLEIGASAVLIVLGGLVWFRGWSTLPAGVPEPVRRALSILGQIGPWQRLAAPAFLALVNWAGQWVSFELALMATGIDTPPAASLAVMLLTNLAGLLRLTPANVGTMQAGFVAGLLPFGVPAGPAIGASLLLQAAQILPLLAAALLLVGWSGLRDLLVQSREPPKAT
jgi:undecaprenyl-diphosphatase